MVSHVGYLLDLQSGNRLLLENGHQLQNAWAGLPMADSCNGYGRSVADVQELFIITKGKQSRTVILYRIMSRVILVIILTTTVLDSTSVGYLYRYMYDTVNMIPSD